MTTAAFSPHSQACGSVLAPGFTWSNPSFRLAWQRLLGTHTHGHSRRAVVGGRHRAGHLSLGWCRPANSPPYQVLEPRLDPRGEGTTSAHHKATARGWTNAPPQGMKTEDWSFSLLPIQPSCTHELHTVLRSFICRMKVCNDNSRPARLCLLLLSEVGFSFSIFEKQLHFFSMHYFF